MKKLLILTFLIASTRLIAQDTTKVLNLSLQARLVEYIAPSMSSPEDVERFSIFLKWRTVFRASKPTGTQTVILDTIGTDLLARIYNQVLSAPEGMGAAALFKAQIATKRSGNSMLNRLCTDYENQWAATLVERRQRGRKILIGQ